MGKQKSAVCVLSPSTAHHAFVFVKFPGERQTFVDKKEITTGGHFCVEISTVNEISPFSTNL